jgi:hypothetical protein
MAFRRIQFFREATPRMRRHSLRYQKVTRPERQSLSAHQAAKPQTAGLKLQNTCIIHVERFAIAEDSDDNAKSNRRFRRRYGHHYENKKLTGDILKVTGESNKREIHGVEHQLNAHEQRDHVALDDYAGRANRKKNGGESEIPGKLWAHNGNQIVVTDFGFR